MTLAYELIPEQIIKNGQLIDLVIERMPLKNDAALARLLRLAPPVISKIRAGKMSLGPSFILRLLDLELPWLRLVDIRLYVPRPARMPDL